MVSIWGLKRSLGLAWIGCVLAIAARAQTAQNNAPTARVPVLVELFTSEGCSDCPPADRLLEELDQKQFVPGAQAIVLSEHVTYWNHDGWTDPFSMPEVDERQKEYGERFRLESIYTPQAVVDGTAQMVGNNGRAVAQAIEAAARQPKEHLTINDAHWENGAAVFTLQGRMDSNARLIAALAADATQSEVKRGENAGRTLHHVAVMRAIKEFNASAAEGRQLRVSGGPLSHGKDAAGLARLVVFVVDRKTGHVTGVAEQPLNR